LQVVDAPLPSLTPKDLKDFLREKSKENPMGDLVRGKLQEALPKPDREE
jgi:hypothetical protein